MNREQRWEYVFSGFRVDVVSRELFGVDGESIPVNSKALSTLIHLIEHRDRVVEKGELLSMVWTGRVVEENNLTQAISALRKAFGAGSGDHRFIVTLPGRGYRFVAEVQTNPKRAGVVAAPAIEPTALAVLPFRTLSGTRDVLLELGLAETLITYLSRSRDLRVSALASCARLGDLAQDPVEAGRHLGVAYVIDGSVQQAPSGARVNVRMLSVADGAAVYAGTFDAGAEHAFSIQDTISAAVVGALALASATEPDRATVRHGHDDPVAYRAYLRGYYLLQRPNESNLRLALESFRHALELDGASARSYAGMAQAYRGLVHLDHSPDEMFGLARAAVDRALRLDPDSVEALVAQARILQLHDRNWQGAEAAMQRAIDLNPSFTEGRFGYAHLLICLGRFDEGLAQMREARALDPLSPLVHSLFAGFLTAARQIDQAHAQIRRALDLQPDFWIALAVRGGLALDRGDGPAAIADFERAAESSHRTSQILAALGMAHAQAGDRRQAQAIVSELTARRSAAYVPATSFAAIAAALGDDDAALDELERADLERDIRMVFLAIDARWNRLRPHPRFQTLARHMGLESDHGYSRL